ncbi:MAG: hypothetical protein AAB638_00735 [Patescibacteria group bacterium]
MEDYPTRNTIAADWNNTNKGQGVLVIDASKDFPGVGLGDPTVETPGSNAYYKWIGASFVKISDAEGLDAEVSLVQYNAAANPIVLDMANSKQRVFKPSAAIAAKTWQVTNDATSLKIDIFFTTTGAHSQTWPANFKMTDPQWDNVTKVWTCFEAGTYKAECTKDGADWYMEIKSIFV